MRRTCRQSHKQALAVPALLAKNRNCQILFFANLWYNSRKAAVILEFQVLSRPLQGALALFDGMWAVPGCLLPISPPVSKGAECGLFRGEPGRLPAGLRRQAGARHNLLPFSLLRDGRHPSWGLENGKRACICMRMKSLPVKYVPVMSSMNEELLPYALTQGKHLPTPEECMEIAQKYSQVPSR